MSVEETLKTLEDIEKDLGVNNHYHRDPQPADKAICEFQEWLQELRDDIETLKGCMVDLVDVVKEHIQSQTEKRDEQA